MFYLTIKNILTDETIANIYDDKLQNILKVVKMLKDNGHKNTNIFCFVKYQPKKAN